MRLRRAALLAIPAILWLSGPVAAQETSPARAQDLVVLAGSVTIARGDVVDEVVVFTGDVTVHGVVEGDVVVLDGPITVTGQVDGSVIAADGVVRLGRSARVGGDAVSSEPIRAAADARVGGEVRGEVRFSLEAPLATLGELLGPVAIAFSVLLVGLGLVLLAPRGLDVVAETLHDAPLASIGWGILLSITAPVAAVALGILVLGLPLGLAFLLSLGLWWLLGVASAVWCVGRALVRPPRGRTIAFLAGWAIVAAVGLVPVLNVAVWTLAAPLGLGAIVVAAWRVRHHGHRGGRHRPGGRPSAEDEVAAGLS
jgi:hypothetical protein